MALIWIVLLEDSDGLVHLFIVELCGHCDKVKTSDFRQIQPNLAKIWQNMKTSGYYKIFSYRPKMKCK